VNVDFLNYPEDIEVVLGVGVHATLSDADIEKWMASHRVAYYARLLPLWKINRIELIPGWTWESKKQSQDE
jgi:hypothetical protein